MCDAVADALLRCGGDEACLRRHSVCVDAATAQATWDADHVQECRLRGESQRFFVRSTQPPTRHPVYVVGGPLYGSLSTVLKHGGKSP